MALADLRVIGPQASFGRYVVSGGTAIQAGEPVICLGDGDAGDGTIDVNTYVLAAADCPVIAAATTTTHRFGGVAMVPSLNVAAGTVQEQFLLTANPVPHIGRIRGKAETAASVDTLTELALLIGDMTLIDWNSTGASDGGELYTIKEAASANTSGLEIMGGNPALSELEVFVAPEAYRREYVA
jgi:hypothetical protein